MQVRKAFTLVEVLIVVVILGILAAVVLPQISGANADAREAAILQDLQTMRAQIELFRLHHYDYYPAWLSGTPQEFYDHMVLASDEDGNTAAPGTAGYPFGPYFVGDVPPNPYTGGRGVMIVADVPGQVPDESLTVTVNGASEIVGWFYNPATGQIKANCTGRTSDGVPLSEL